MNRQGEPPRRVDKPEPGYFMLRLVRGGPEVPARIMMCAEIDGQLCGEPHADPFYAGGVAKVWHGGRVVTKAEYDMAMKRHRPPANKRVDPRKLEIEW